ncbi:MAG: hypothetical protein ACRDT8_08425, partial [Micromonosporaceae bacterium]
TGDMLVTASSVIQGYDPGAEAFGADGVGGFGELCRVLHGQWSSALEARAGEAAQHGARLLDTATLLGKVAAHYADTDVTLSTSIARVDGDTGPSATLLANAPGAPGPRELTIRPGEG